MNGKDLTQDLGRWLQNGGSWAVWTNLPLGDNLHRHDVPRIDVLAMRKSYNNPVINGYEVKVTRGDFLRDVKESKYTKYLPHCNFFYFATPTGLIKVGELPEGCGLIVRGDSGWKTLRNSNRRAIQVGEEVLIKLIIKGYEDYFPQVRELDKKKFEQLQEMRAFANEFGHKKAHELASAQEFIKAAESIKEEIDKLLRHQHLNFEGAVFALQRHVYDLMGHCKYIPEGGKVLSAAHTLLAGNSWRVVEELREVADVIENKQKEAVERR